MSATLQECNNYVKEVGVAWVRERVPGTGVTVYFIPPNFYPGG